MHAERVFLIHLLLNGRWIKSYRWPLQYEKQSSSRDLSFKRHYDERGVSGCLCWAGCWSFFRHNIKKPAGEHSLLSIRVWECSILEKCLPRRPPAPVPFHFVLVLCWFMTIATYSLQQNILLHKLWISITVSFSSPQRTWVNMWASAWSVSFSVGLFACIDLTGGQGP
jgi:hypothetical protein